QGNVQYIFCTDRYVGDMNRHGTAPPTLLHRCGGRVAFRTGCGAAEYRAAAFEPADPATRARVGFCALSSRQPARSTYSGGADVSGRGAPDAGESGKGGPGGTQSSAW